MSVIGDWYAAVRKLFPGDVIHEEAPSLHKKSTKAEMSARNTAALKRARKQAKAKAANAHK